ncbi:hypothetical protein FOMA001_g1964 [Fusarium oxysporum f. sp. matthiolae]|nr:hypothetical protein FOMA001_g1964 [Fusarium oxysporum f. sp. matthiolae]
MPNNMARAFWKGRQHMCGIRLSIIQDSIVYTQATICGLIQVGETLFGLTVSHVFPISDSLHDQYSAQNSGLEEQTQYPIMGTNSQSSDANMDGSSTISGRWHNPLRQSMVFDWALVEMPSFETYNPHPDKWDDVNLVETTSGDFRPVLVVPEMPNNETPVVLATPGSAFCLVIGEDALVSMPDSPNFYLTWVLRMEQLQSQGKWILGI